MNLDERMELAGLAHRRYPDVELPLAIHFFLSDRRRAGLGALDERKRRVGADINNYKRNVYEHGQVRYHLVRHMPARREFAKMNWEDFDPGNDLATATVQTVFIPARTEHLCVAANYRDFTGQGGRRVVAQMLRKARRQMAAQKATPSP